MANKSEHFSFSESKVAPAVFIYYVLCKKPPLRKSTARGAFHSFEKKACKFFVEDKGTFTKDVPDFGTGTYYKHDQTILGTQNQLLRAAELLNCGINKKSDDH